MKTILFAAVAIMLAACNPADGAARPDPAAPTALAAAQSPPAAASQASAPLRAAGSPTALKIAEDQGDALQWAASVDQLHALPDQNAKIFGVFGGDPAANGLHTYIAFLGDVADGWKIYEIGDFLSFKVLRSGPGVIDLEITETDYDTATDQMGERTRRVILTFTPPTAPDWTVPETVTITEALK